MPSRRARARPSPRSRRVRFGALLLAAPLLLLAAWWTQADGLELPALRAAGAAPALASANDNRVAAGRQVGQGRIVHLEAQLASWRPDAAVDTTVTVQAFGERGGTPSIPGPLLRATQGAELRVTLRNLIADSTLIVHGLRAGATADDTLHVAPGAMREVRVRTDVPGTYLYWGTTTNSTFEARRGRDGQLTGALVIDAAGTTPSPHERIFVMTVIDVLPDTAAPPPHEDIWELAINGTSWPHTERLQYTVADTVEWRWLNGTYLPHPMHLHGFHFQTLARGDGRRDVELPPDEIPEVVTEFMAPGGTFRMAWVPTRAGNWLMHCHMLPHVSPFPDRPDSLRAHEAHDAERHATDAMAGLVLGITVAPRAGTADAPDAEPTRQLRLLVQQAPASPGMRPARGYVLQRGAEPDADSVEVPGSPLVLVRGETTAITVVNRLRRPTTVHWHGMELLSLYDGVSGWSGLDARRAPLVAPGDSFTVAITPPRAGTFIYHTHMDEEREIGDGLYGPLIVLEPDEAWNPATDWPMIIGDAVVADTVRPALNGQRSPALRTAHVGTTYRFRVINIGRAEAIAVSLLAGTAPAGWTQVAKDGAALPPALRRVRTAPLNIGVGETYDFEWTPTTVGDAALEVRLPFGLATLRQPLRVAPRLR